MSVLIRGGERRLRAGLTQPRAREAFAERLHAGASCLLRAGSAADRAIGPHGSGAQHNRPPGTKTGRQRLEVLYRTRAPQRATISGSFQIDSMRDAKVRNRRHVDAGKPAK